MSAPKNQKSNPFFAMLAQQPGMLSLLKQVAPNRVNQWEKLQAKLNAGGLTAKQQAKIHAKMVNLGNQIGNRNFNMNTPQGLAAMQQLANQQQAQQNFNYNNPNETDAYGNKVTNTIDPVTGKATRTTVLSGAEQQRLEAQRQREGLFNTGVNNAYNEYNNAPSLTNDFSADRQRIENQLYDRFAQRADERYAKEQTRLEQSLYNRGITPETQRKAWASAQEQQGQNKNDAYQGAMFDAVRAGGTEQQNMWNMQLQRRNQPLQEMGYFQSQIQGPQSGQFTGFQGSQYQAPDYAGLGTNFANMTNQYNMNQDSLKNAKDIASMNNATTLQVASMKGGGGGGGEQYVPGLVQGSAPRSATYNQPTYNRSRATGWFGNSR